MIKRALVKLLFHLVRFMLKPLDGRLPRLYMHFYQAILKLVGVNLRGRPRYISTSVRFDDFEQITLSERVVISEKVILLTHDYSVTTGLIALGKSPKTDIAFIKPIFIDMNVFIGMGSLIMPGTVINKNVVIGAGSVVRGVIPEDSIVIGNPCKVIGSLKDKAKKWEVALDESNSKIDAH